MKASYARWPNAGLSGAVTLLLVLVLCAARTVAQNPGGVHSGATIGDLLEEESVESGAAAPAGPSLTGTFLRMIGWAAGVVAVGGALLLVIKKFTPAGRMLTGNGMIHVLGRTSLSPRHTVFVVRIARHRVLVVGLSGDRMVTLSEISDASEILDLVGDFRSKLDAATAGDATSALGDPGVAAAVQDHGLVESPVDLRRYQREIDKFRKVVSGWRSLMSRGYCGSATERSSVEEVRS